MHDHMIDDIDVQILRALADGDRKMFRLRRSLGRDGYSMRIKDLKDDGYLDAFQSYRTGAAAWFPIRLTEKGEELVAALS